MGTSLRELRNARKWTHEQAAERMGISRGQFIKLERGERKLTARTISLAAKAFNVSEAEVLNSLLTVPIVGYVGAGGAVHFDGEYEGQYDEAPRPPGASPNTVALRIKGDSMPGIAEDNWYVYYDEREDGVPDIFIGKLCIVALDDNRVLVKRVYRGRLYGQFDLISTGYEPIRDATVVWSAKVIWIKPN